MAIEIVYFHKTTCDFPVRYVKVYQRVAPKYGNFIGFDPSPDGNNVMLGFG
jgi:hypothetical protein